MKAEDYKKVKKYIFSKMKSLPKNLYYHNPGHMKDIIKTSEKLGKMEGVSEKDLLVLKTAALFHDIGFLERYKGHEAAGKKMAEKILPKFNYTKKEIETITNMIMATRMPQNPKTKYEKILCDADLNNLGRRDFFTQTENVRKELWAQGTKIPKKRWYKNTLKLMENHSYHTKSGKKLRGEGKKKNMEKLRAVLESKR